ncbi:MAG: glycosyltransferase family 39 protein, partial [Actinobacteria bacterium]|nr:glycosyltransferase family 39 protein [Actinomycetota bacterium]
MSAVASPPAARSVTLSDRLLAAVPLASVYIWLSGLLMVEAWQRITPWLFGDELEFTQLSRSIAATGHAAERGQSHSPDSIYPYVTAIFWKIHDVAAAYSAIKYVDVLLMVAVVFPVYFLARMCVGRTAALFAAAGAGAIPSMAYSSYLVEEPLAYPYTALCFFLIAKALITKRRPWIVGAIVASAFAPAVRTELAIVPVVLFLAFLFAVWSSAQARAWRSTWSIGDWSGFLLLVLGVLFAVSALISHHSFQWYVATAGYKHRQIVEGDWAAGALALGMGVIPFMAGLAALFPVRGEPPSREVRMFRSVATAGIIAFGMYTAIKAAYLSTAFATRVEERNLMYIAPLLFIGTALVFSRRRVSTIGLVLAGAYTTYLMVYALYHVTQYPYQMGVQLYSDSLGFAIVQQGNRFLGWTPHFVRWLLLAISLYGIAVLLVPRFFRGRERAVSIVLAVTATAIVAWNVTGELAAATGTKSIALGAATTLKHPFSWVDDATHLKPAVYLGQEEIDQNPEWLVEFWNRSIVRVSSLDGTLGGPGPAGGPNFTAAGELYNGSEVTAGAWRYAYGVEDAPCIDLAGKTVATHPYRAGGLVLEWDLVHLTQPNRMLSDCTGIYPDGWTGTNDSQYYRYSGPGGWLRIAYSRPDNYPTGPSPVRITLGSLRIVNKQPILSHVLRQENGSID